MQRDVKIGIAIGVLLIALVAIFMFTRHNASQTLMPAGSGDARAPLAPAVEPVAPVGLNAEDDLLGTPTVSASEVPMPAAPGADSGTAGLPGGIPTSIGTTSPQEETPTGTSEPAPVAGAAAKQHIVAAGESLSKIAARYYGTGGKENVDRIYNANKSAIGSDPNKLKVGMKLVIPNVSTSTTLVPVTIRTSSTQPATEKTHTVAAGESLTKIATRYYGSASKADIDRIYNANKSVIGSDRNKLRVGIVLTIPPKE